MNDLVSALDFDLYKSSNFGGNPSKCNSKIRPNNAEMKWVPQTIYDSVWVFYIFKTKKDRIEWENSIPDDLKFLINRKLVNMTDSFGKYWYEK